MGLDVELVRIEQAGTSPRRRRAVELAMVGDTRFRFAKAVERVQRAGTTPMLGRVDLYGTLELMRPPSRLAYPWALCTASELC